MDSNSLNILKGLSTRWAQEDAARKLAEEQARQQAQQNQPTGIGAILAGIGNSINNVGKGLGSFFGGAATNNAITVGLDALFNGKSFNQASKDAEKRQDDWTKSIYGTDSTKDAYTKNLGSSLDAAATLSEFIPGIGTGAKLGVSAIKGGVSGVGNTLAQQGENATAEDLLKSGTIGAISAGVGNKVGGALGQRAINKPATGLIGKAAQSGIGRGAITGAASGAVGGGLGTILNGGDFGQTLSGALQGAGGAATSAIYGLAGAGLNKIKNKIENGPLSPQAQLAAQAKPEKELSAATKKRQTATGWDDQEIDASKRNAFQKLGKTLQDTGEITENNDIYGRLNNNTARDVQKRGTIKTLKEKYGYTSSDYDKAADLSEATNAWIKNEAKTSGASGYDTKLTDKVSLNNYKDGDLLVDVSDKGAKQYRKSVQQLLDSARVEGGGVDEYSAAALYDAADIASRKAHDNYEASHNKMDGSLLGSEKANEKNALSQAYSNFAKEARAAANNMLGGEIDDITRSNLVKMLKSSGAPEAAVKTLSKAKTLSELKTMTSPLETARDMNDQMMQAQLKRGATTDSSKANVLNEAIRASGAPQAAKAVAAPIGQVVGKAEQGIGKVIEKIGDAAAGKVNTVPGKVIAGIANTPSTIESGLKTGAADFSWQKTPTNATIGDIAVAQIARQEGNKANNAINANTQAEQAAQALSEAQTAYNTANANALATQQAIATTPIQTNGAQQLDRIKTAMELALAAGDLTSYGKLADLYTTATKIYGTETEVSNPLSKLTSTQVENINKLDTAGNAIDELEALFNKGGGGQGLIGGNAANFMASLGLNSDVATYNSLSKGLINQINAAIGKTDALNNEGEVARAMELIPKFTDDAQTAKNKLEQLRQMLATNKQTVYQNYGIQL